MRRGILPLVALVGAAVGAASASRPAGDPDVFWHLATARETLTHGIVRTDAFSWTANGAPVATDQWLGQLLFYGAYLVDGWSGIVLVRAAAVAVIVGFAFASALLAAKEVRPIVALLATLPAMFISRYVWSERPELLGLACLAVLLLLLRVGRDGSHIALALVPPLILVWANLHGSFAVGAVLVLFASVEGARRDRGRRRVWLVVGAASLAATLLTPAGAGVWTAPGYHLFSPPRELQEWAVPDVRTGIGALFGLTLALVIATAILAPPLPLREALVVVPLALLAMTAVRQTPLFALAAAPYLAMRGPSALTALLALIGRTPPRLAPPSPAARPFVFVSLVAAAVFAVLAVIIAPARPDEDFYPVAALAVLPAGPGLLNAYDWGGWLIWSAPATPVFIDGRYTPYLGPILDDYRTVVEARQGWSERLKNRQIRFILVRPGDAVAVRGIEMGWTVLGRGPNFVLLRVP